MRKNQAMSDFLHGKDVDSLCEMKPLPEPLTEILSSGFVEAEDCVFLAGHRATSPHARLGDFSDRTGFECFVNKVNVYQHLRGQTVPNTVVKILTVCFARELKTRLAEVYPSYNFTVFASFGAIETFVNFHRNRPGESWLSNNLEGYLDEAVLVL